MHARKALKLDLSSPKRKIGHPRGAIPLYGCLLKGKHAILHEGKMSLPQLILWCIGAVLITIGAINLRPKKDNAWLFLLPGIVIFILGCLLL
jgi:hypothetical protein